MSDHHEDAHTHYGAPAGRHIRGVWTVLAAGQPDDDVDALRWRLLDHWAELHELKCGCALERPIACLKPIPNELIDWLFLAAAAEPPLLRVVD